MRGGRTWQKQSMNSPTFAWSRATAASLRSVPRHARMQAGKSEMTESDGRRARRTGAVIAYTQIQREREREREREIESE